MSILIKGNNGIGGSSGSGKGFPPGDALNIVITNGYKVVLLKWEDPDTSIYNGTTLSTWYSTIIVRKENSVPTSIKDGIIVLTNTEKNKYKDSYFTDSNVEVGKTYYYRFYTMNTDKVYNDSTNMIYRVIVTAADPILKNNSWEIINTISESGIASDIWKVGDEIDITLSGTYNETVTLQIWDFNHFDKSDGSGKAGIVFGMKNLMKNTKVLTPNSSSNSGGWNNTTMKKTTMGQILKSMPSNLQNYIKEVNTYANEGGANSSSSKGKLSKDKVFLPGCTEVGFTFQSSTESGQKKFPIFTDNNSRIKKLSNGSGDAYWWWTRSPYYTGSYGFVYVYSDGHSVNNSYPNNSYGVCFCFNV